MPLRAALLALILLAPPSLAADPPRHVFTPGEELTYRSASVFVYQPGSKRGAPARPKAALVDAARVTVWVVSADAEGGARVLVRPVEHSGRATFGFPPSLSFESPSTSYAVADINGFGEVEPNPTVRRGGNPQQFFPRLPEDEDELRDRKYTHFDGDTEVEVELADAGANRLVAVRRMAFDPIYLMTHRAELELDPATRRLVRCVTRDTQGSGFVGTGTSVLEFVSSRKLPADELAKLAADVGHYLPAVSEYAAASKVPDGATAAEAKAKLDAAGAGLAKLGPVLTHPVVKAAFDAATKSHADAVRWAAADAKRFDAVLQKPAHPFDCPDLDGKRLKVGDLEGKVVVLDFWYRGCGWCVKAMPQMNQLAADFAGSPVAILGMNTDSDIDDAKFVVEKMSLAYPTLRIDRELPAKYGVSGFPTLAVIDKKGVLRHLHVGYSPELRQSVGAKVRELLGE